MKHLPYVFLLLLLGCPPGLHNDDDDSVGDDDDSVADDDDSVGDDDDSVADDDDSVGDDDDSVGDDDTVDPPLLPFGAECTDDFECNSRICWDFMDYDPWCGGAICSDVCSNAFDCQEMAQAAGAPDPDGARCGDDGLCDLIGTGMGSFWCADGTAGS